MVDLIQLAILKGRNIIYYRERDTRERCQYIHVVRSYRQTLVNLLKTMPTTHPNYSMFCELVKVINPKVKSEGCIQTIIEMKAIFERYGIIID